MTKEEILDKINNVEVIMARNSMGCSENWYNAYFAIKHTFSEKELANMTEQELNDLIKLADNIAEGLY